VNDLLPVALSAAAVAVSVASALLARRARRDAQAMSETLRKWRGRR
jgi:hypothetical protein